jgi:hypothetical protein
MALYDSMTTEEIKDVIYRKIRPEIRKLAMMQEQKFALYDEERGNPFDCEDLQFMKDRLHEETSEMYRDMKTGQTPNTVWKEAADRCNFILMQVINYEREYKKKINKRVKS